MLTLVKQPPERSTMAFSLAIAIIVIADVALIAGLAFVMSRASLLTPHVSRRKAAHTTAEAVAAEAATIGATAATTPNRRVPARASRRPQASAV